MDNHFNDLLASALYKYKEYTRLYICKVWKDYSWLSLVDFFGFRHQAADLPLPLALAIIHIQLQLCWIHAATFSTSVIDLVNNGLLVIYITLRLQRLKAKGFPFDMDEGAQLRVFYNKASIIGALDQHCWPWFANPLTVCLHWNLPNKTNRICYILKWHEHFLAQYIVSEPKWKHQSLSKQTEELSIKNWNFQRMSLSIKIRIF